MQEFYRVLKPGGVLLFAESCKKFIHSLSIRLLFRHPMAVQKTAEEYLELIRQTGFQVRPDAISKPYLWWSRPDFGAMEWFGFKIPENREETLVNLVAVKAATNQVL
jgi:ubiquinone/menaquinone biosynthesis C-methylase UbiE